MNGKFLKTMSILCAGVVGTVGLAAFAGCNANGKNSVVTLDVNPSLELIVDKNNVVVSVYGANEDGQVLLYGETENLIGKKIDEAVTAITNEAAELGYLSEENKVVQYSVVSSKGEKKESELSSAIESSVKVTAESLGLSVETDTSASYSLNRKYEQFKHETNIEIPVAKFRLALEASETGEITLEAAAELTDKELIDTISRARATVTEYATKAYIAAKAEAFRVYDSVAQVALDNVYSTYYLKNLASHKDTFWYGSAYASYATGAHNLDAIANVAEKTAKLTASVLNSEQTAQVLAALGMTEEEIDELKDSEGNITLESVEAYANKLFKNSPASAELEAMKERLTVALNAADVKIRETIAKAAENYADEIESITKATQSLINGLSGAIEALLPDSVKNAIADMQDTVKQLTALTKDGVTVSDLRAAADVFEKKASDTLKLIEKDLSKDELAEVEQIKEGLQSKINSAKTAMEETLAAAERQARARLQALKDARTNA